MKFTQVLYKQHLGRMIKFNWFANTKQKPVETHAEWLLTNKMGIKVVDPIDVVKPKPPVSTIAKDLLQFALIPRKPARDENHPEYREKPCLRLLDDDLLVEGIQQAQLITKTLIINESLPDKIENLIESVGDDIDHTVQKMIEVSNIFDAQQVKLPKKKDPLRPAWVFPRDYGINGVRKSRNLTVKMIQLCESLCGSEIAQQRQIVHNGSVQVPLVKDGDLLKFDINLDFLLTSTKALKPMGSPEDAADKTLPEFYPLLPTVGLRHDHFYDLETRYPVSEKSPWANPHTIFIYHDVEKVKNMTELPIREEQLLARSMTKSFITAATWAKKIYGDNVEDLPEPIVIQCVQLDSQKFHFSVFQLNTLNITGNEGKFNYWWSIPQIDLFEKAMYEDGRPVLSGYNPEVFKRIMAFYKNV